MNEMLFSEGYGGPLNVLYACIVIFYRSGRCDSHAQRNIIKPDTESSILRVSERFNATFFIFLDF